MSKRPWRGKKRSAAWNATKSEYFLKWDAIQGEQIPKDMLEFFIHVRDRLEKPFEDQEDKDLFLQNVFSQTADQKVSLMRNSLASQIIEQLIPSVQDAALLQFAAAIYEHLRELVQDQFGSHVIQTLLLSMTCRIQADCDLRADLESWIMVASDQFLEDLAPLARHQYGSHVLRTCLECLAGRRAPGDLTRSRRSQCQRWRTAGSGSRLVTADQLVLQPEKSPPDFHRRLIEIGKAVKTFDGLGESLSDANFSTVVQVLLHLLSSLPAPKLCRNLVKRLGKVHFGGRAPADADAATDLPPVFENESCVRVMEAALAICDEEMSRKLFDKFYRNRLEMLMRGNVTRISVQRLIENCPNQEVLGLLFDEIETIDLNDWWYGSRLPTALAQTCVRLSANQARFMKLAQRVSDCAEADRGSQLAACVLYQRTSSDFQRIQHQLATVALPLDGSLLLQAMLKFSKPTKLITSLTSLDGGQLSAIFQTAPGSHVIDALLASPHMGEKGRSRLLETLKDELVSLACSKHGSRALDALWAAANLGQRTFIAETLAPHEKQLRNDFFGKFAVQKLALELFVKRRPDWTTYIKREINKRKMFADLFPPSAAGATATATGKRTSEQGTTAEKRSKKARKSDTVSEEASALISIDRQGVQSVLDDLE